MKKVEDPHCPFYTNINQTVSRLFVSGPSASSLWLDFIEHGVSLLLKRPYAFLRMKSFMAYLTTSLFVQP